MNLIKTLKPVALILSRNKDDRKSKYKTQNLRNSLEFARIVHVVTDDIKTKTDRNMEEMASAGVHFGAPRSRRHPSTKSGVFGTKNDIEIVDLEKTQVSLEKAREFVAKLRKDGKIILLVGNKSEAREAVRHAATRMNLPYVALRWIGGTLTNFDEIRKRLDRLSDLRTKGASGDLSKYTKKERARISHEVKDLERFFSGISEMKEIPSALFVIDSDKEHTAVTEARKMHIPVISLSGTDCDIGSIEYPIIGNDKAIASIRFIVDIVLSAYKV